LSDIAYIALNPRVDFASAADAGSV
jgi:hypothetical protein